MTIAQELEAFLHKHNREVRESVKISLIAACVMWPISFLAVLFFGARMIIRSYYATAPSANMGLLTWAGIFVMAFVLGNVGFTLFLVSKRYEHDPVAASSDPDGVNMVELALTFFMLPARMTADAVTRRRAVVVFAPDDRRKAEELMAKLKDAGGGIPWRDGVASAEVMVRLVKIKAVRFENDRYGNPMLSRRLPPEEVEVG